MHESLIQALRFCASGEKFPRLCTEACPLYCAKGNAKTCTACIDNLLRQAADALEKAEECSMGTGFCPNCGAKMDDEREGENHEPGDGREEMAGE